MAKEGLYEGAVKLFVLKDGKLLVLTATNTQMGDIPGGRLNKGESLFKLGEALGREIKEELGAKIHLEVSPEPLFMSPYKSKKDTQEVMGFWYLGKCSGGEIELSGEHVTFEWVELSKAASHFTGDFRLAVEKFVRLISQVDVL